MAAWLVPAGYPVVAQTSGTLAAGASIVEYDGFLSSGAVVLAPALRFDGARLSLAAQGSWTRFESGNTVLQANAAAGWLAGSRGPLHVEVSGSAGVSRYAREPTTGHLLGGLRLHLLSGSMGGWLGLTTGTVSGASARMPLEWSLAVWRVEHRVALVGSVTAVHQGDVRYMDALAAVRWTGPAMDLEVRGGARPWAQGPDQPGSPTQGMYGELSAELDLSPRLALTLAGGRYASDPVRRVLGASYLSAGIRLQGLGRNPRSVPVHLTSVLGNRAVPTANGVTHLQVDGPPDQRIIRIRAPGATAVELMADFTDWTAVPLTAAAPGLWEARMPLGPGLYRVNLRLNGGPWTVPGGLRVERNEFGGSVGLLFVP